MKNRVLAAVLLSMSVAPWATAQMVRTNSGFTRNSVARNDDGSSTLTSLGFTINLFGKTRAAAYVNNNGNITFDTALSTYTPFGLRSTQREIIAPFFADVDTRPDGSNLVTYGQDTVNGHRAFGANYVNVGYYANHTDKLNSFQVVLVQREDLSPGDFDIEFNYDRIVWETGDASGGVDGYGGTSASAGWSNGTDTSYELPGSLIPGSFLDGGPYSLVRQSISGAAMNAVFSAANVHPGRLIFRARDGVISPGIVISGGTLPDATLGSPYSAAFSVSGATPPYTWTFQPDVAPPPGLAFDGSGVLSGVPTTPGLYSFTVGVTGTTEDGPVTVYQRSSVTIRQASIQITSSCPLPDARVNSPYGLSLAATGASSIGWRFSGPGDLPPGFGFTSGGFLGGTPQQPGTYALNFDATADGAAPAHLQCKLNVLPTQVDLAGSCILPHATVGVPFSDQLLPVGGYAPYTFQLIGTLPVGVALTPDGSITGTSSFAHSWSFNIAATDSKGVRAVKSCSLVVDPAKFTVSACPLPGGTTGIPYSVNLGSQFTWSVQGNLPGGLTLAPNGVLSGTPMTAGGAQFLLLAANPQGQQSAQACSLVVTRGPLGLVGCPLQNGRVGDPYFATLSGAGGALPYTFSNVAGTFPSGLNISSDGHVTGVPNTAGTYGFTLRLRDGGTSSVLQACQLTVAPATIEITTPCPLPDAHAGESYAQSIAVSGGRSPYQFTFGTLPDGLTGSASGAITGNPLYAGGRSFSIQVTDSVGGMASQACSIAVGAPQVPQITIVDPPATVPTATTSLVLQVQMAAPYSAPVKGVLTLAVSADTAGNDPVVDTPDPHLALAGGQLSASFTIPAGQTTASIPVVSTGTTTATVTVTLSQITASGATVPEFPTAKIFHIAPAAPTLTSACYVRTNTEQGVELTIRVTGFSNTRELQTARVTVPGIAPFLGPLYVPHQFVFGSDGTAVVDISSPAFAYYASSVNVPPGGGFTLTLPVSLEHDPTYLAPSATIQNAQIELLNKVGGSGPKVLPQCP